MQTFKSLLVTLLILGGGFLAYDYYLAPDGSKLVFRKPLAPATVPDAAPAPNEMAPAPAAILESTAMPASTGVAAAATPMSEPSKPAGFVPPPVPTVEEATGNWSRFPSTTFPRLVKLSQAVAFKTSFGESQVPSGGEVTAVSGGDGMLTISPTAQSPLRSVVAMDATDFKATLAATYNAWRAQKIEAARQEWVKQSAMAGSQPAPAISSDGRPAIGPDGTYPLLLESMKAGQVTEVTPTSIKKWGTPEAGELNGQKCWVVTVDYEARTSLGTVSTTALAKVVNGKVAGWFYQGSGEPIP